MKTPTDCSERNLGNEGCSEALRHSNVRVPEYDILRVMACLLVILGHAVMYTPMRNQPNSLDAADFIGVLNSFIYSFHMPLFFMLSGACASLGAKTITYKMLKKRFVRLLLPYFVFGAIIAVPIRYMCFSEFAQINDLKTFYIQLFTFRITWHLWFLPALFAVAMMTAAIHRVTCDGVLSVVVVIVLSALSYFVIPHIGVNFTPMKGIYNHWLWYAAGLYFLPALIRWNPGGYLWLCAVGFAAFAVFFVTVLLRNEGIIDVSAVSSALCAVAGAVAFVSLSKILARLHWHEYTWMSVLVSASMGIYLYHFPLQWIVKQMALHYGWENHYLWVFFLLQLIAVSLISLLCWRLVSKCGRRWKVALGA